MRSVRVKMPCCKGQRRPPAGGRDERQKRFIHATADVRDRIEGKGEHCATKQRVAKVQCRHW